MKPLDIAWRNSVLAERDAENSLCPVLSIRVLHWPTTGNLVDLIRLWRGFSTEIFLGKKRNLCYTLPIPWG